MSALLTIGLFGIGINRQIIHGQKFGNHPMSDQGLIIAFILVILLFVLVMLLFGFAKLITVIDKSGIAFKFQPFQLRYSRICWDQVEKYSVISYHPIRDFGGWGIKSKKGITAFNVSGDKGLQIQLKSGKSIMIGTQKDVELNQFLGNLAPLG
jgi:hypothetical protein